MICKTNNMLTHVNRVSVVCMELQFERETTQCAWGLAELLREQCMHGV